MVLRISVCLPFMHEFDPVSTRGELGDRNGDDGRRLGLDINIVAGLYEQSTIDLDNKRQRSTLVERYLLYPQKTKIATRHATVKTEQKMAKAKRENPGRTRFEVSGIGAIVNYLRFLSTSEA